MLEFAAILFTILTSVLVLFQFGLAIGMPWDEYAMGGYYPGRFSWKLRLSAILQGILLIIFALIVLDKANLFRLEYFSIPSMAIWFVVAFSFLASILNFITKSAKEKKIWFPISILLLITSLIVALN